MNQLKLLPWLFLVNLVDHGSGWGTERCASKYYHGTVSTLPKKLLYKNTIIYPKKSGYKYYKY